MDGGGWHLPKGDSCRSSLGEGDSFASTLMNRKSQAREHRGKGGPGIGNSLCKDPLDENELGMLENRKDTRGAWEGMRSER